eukprot:scaffold9987_cov145-Skeletonema_marinoi.AAC.8
MICAKHGAKLKSVIYAMKDEVVVINKKRMGKDNVHTNLSRIERHAMRDDLLAQNHQFKMNVEVI